MIGLCTILFKWIGIKHITHTLSAFLALLPGERSFIHSGDMIQELIFFERELGKNNTGYHKAWRSFVLINDTKWKIQ